MVGFYLWSLSNVRFRYKLTINPKFLEKSEKFTNERVSGIWNLGKAFNLKWRIKENTNKSPKFVKHFSSSNSSCWKFILLKRLSSKSLNYLWIWKNRCGDLSSSWSPRKHFRFIFLLIQWALRSCSKDPSWFVIPVNLIWCIFERVHMSYIVLNILCCRFWKVILAQFVLLSKSSCTGRSFILFFFFFFF